MKMFIIFPLLLLIGWQGGEPVKDEPQHVKQGKVTLETLKCSWN